MIKSFNAFINEMAIPKSQLQEYDEIEIFDSTYIKVKKGDLYNLVDNDGNYLSTTWFNDIKPNTGGGVDVVVKNSKGVLTNRSYTDYHNIKKSEELYSLVKNTDFLDFIDMSDIIVVTPYILPRVDKKRGVKIIAQVNYMGDMLLIGIDGKLYNQDGSEYEEVKFSISQANINRLVKITDKANKLLSVEYDKTKIDDAFDNHVYYRAGLFVFGFNKNKSFDTNHDPVISDSSVQWGGDTIKLRIFVKYMTAVNQDKLEKYLDELEFGKWDVWKKEKFRDLKTRTKEYTPTEIDKLFTDISNIMKVENYK